ncbi:CorA family divalent cation transporter [Acuticoccus sediminis]|nr:CorA family divalent cation transporter [Acuticoccus sediminis]
MDSHIRFALHLSGELCGKGIDDEEDVAALVSGEAPVWLHLSADHPDTNEWIKEHLSYLGAPVREALLEPETRPRALWTGSGLMVILRVINFRENEDPEDMVPVRIWLDEHRIVSLSSAGVQSISHVAKLVRSGAGPRTPVGLLSRIVEEVTDRIEKHAAALEDRVDELETETITNPREEIRRSVAAQRLALTELWRYIPPQREAVRAIAHAGEPLLDETGSTSILEQHDQLTRVSELLAAQRERLQTIRDELGSAQAELLNRNLYVLSVISAIFLPLGFMTGLMGINMGGIPGAHSSLGFWVFAVLMILVAVGMLVALRRARML